MSLRSWRIRLKYLFTTSFENCRFKENTKVKVSLLLVDRYDRRYSSSISLVYTLNESLRDRERMHLTAKGNILLFGCCASTCITICVRRKFFCEKRKKMNGARMIQSKDSFGRLFGKSLSSFRHS